MKPVYLLTAILVAAVESNESEYIRNNLRSLPLAFAVKPLRDSSNKEDTEGQQEKMRGLAESHVMASKFGSNVMDDLDAEELETPDIWDILIWIGAWIGRLARTIVIGLVKLCYALYTGMVYGWESARPEEA